MKAQGLEVPQELVEKWFNYAAETRDQTFDHRSWKQMHLAALAFDLPNPERFIVQAVSQSKGSPFFQREYREALEVQAKAYMKRSDSGIEIKIEREQLMPVIDSRVDYKVTLSGGPGSGEKDTVFWVQLDGPHHFVDKGKGREFTARTKLQNMVVMPRLEPSERFLRVDYWDVKLAGRRVKDSKKGPAIHTGQLLQEMVEEHQKRRLGLAETSIKGWARNGL